MTYSSPPASIHALSQRSPSAEVLGRERYLSMSEQSINGLNNLQSLSDPETPELTQEHIAIVEQLCRPTNNERLLISANLHSYQVEEGGQAAKKVGNCNFKNSKLSIFETSSDDIWKITRRIVIRSSMSSSYAACHSHCEIHFPDEGKVITNFIRVSDH